MNEWFLFAVIGLFGFMALNFWAKSFFIALACIFLSIYVLVQLPTVTSYQYYLVGAGYLILFFNLIFGITQTERF